MFQIDTKKLLALITLVGFFGIILILFFAQIPAGNLDLLKTLCIALIAIVSAVSGYYYGSSEGSRRKTELLVPGDTPPASDKSTAGFVQVPLLLMCASLLLVGCLVNGCATTSAPPGSGGAGGGQVSAKDTTLQTAGKSLLAVKSTIVTAATATDALCKAGKIPADKCAQAKAAYEQAKPAYDAAVDSYLLMTSVGGDPGDFGRALSRVQAIATNLLTLSGGN